MEFIIWLLIILGSIGLISIIGALIMCWVDSIDNTPKIKFKSFKNFYELNDKRWICYGDSVACNTLETFGFYNAKFHFGFIDFYRYKLWQRSIARAKENQRKARITAEMVAAVKKDIAASEENAQQYQNEAVRTLWSIINRSEE